MIAALGEAGLASRLRAEGLCLVTGPFTTRLRSDIDGILQGLLRLYGDYTAADASSFCDFTVDIRSSGGLRRMVRPQARFMFDGRLAFEPLPRMQAFPLLEWAMNWCISSQVCRFLLIHSAVVERGGRAMILPAPPGSGKSTLCAALIHSGWRLLSDEVALVELTGAAVHPLVRAVSLKNQSIDVIGRFAASAVFNPPTHGTAKGTVTHMQAPHDHVRRMNEPARPGWVVFPRWQAGAPATLTPRSPAGTLVELARNSFNFGLLGPVGFEAMANLVQQCRCHDFVYGQLDEAVALFNQLADTP